MSNADIMKHFLSVCLAIFLSTVLFAQSINLTPYEKGRKDIADEALTMIFDAMSEADQLAFGYSFFEAINKTNDIHEQTAIAEDFVFGLCGIGDMFKTEANYLAESIFPSQAYKGKTLQYLSSVGEWYKTKRSELEKTKTAEDSVREMARLQANSGWGRIIKEISKSFSNWYQKGEYETTAQYNKRIGSQSQSTLDFICFNTLNESWKKGVTLSRDKYDADNMALCLLLNYSDANDIVRDSYLGCIKMSPAVAKDFRMNGIDLTKSIALGMVRQKGRLIPSHIRLAYKPDMQTLFHLMTLSQESLLTISIDELSGIPNSAAESLKDYSFNYSDYAKNISTMDDVMARMYEIQSNYQAAYPDTPENWFPLVKETFGLFFTSNKEEFFKSEQYCLSPAETSTILQRFDDYCSAQVYEWIIRGDTDKLIVPSDGAESFFKANNVEETIAFIITCAKHYAEKIAPEYNEDSMRNQQGNVEALIYFVGSMAYRFPDRITVKECNDVAQAFVEANTSLSNSYKKWVMSSEYKSKVKLAKKYADSDPDSYNRITQAPYWVYVRGF